LDVGGQLDTASLTELRLGTQKFQWLLVAVGA